MKTVTQFVATCLLVVSMSAVALADGGATQGPGLAAPLPPPDCTTACSEAEEAACTENLAASTQNLAVETMMDFVIWLAESIY